MVERRRPGATSGRAAPGVIDVGDGEARPADDERADDERADDERDGDGDEPGAAGDDELGGEELAGAGVVIDVGGGDPDDDPDAGPDGDPDGDPDAEPARPARSTRLARSDGGSRGSLARHDPLAAYMQETRRYPLLTPAEEHDLAVKLFEHGDSAAGRRLVEANLRLVVKIAYEYRRAHRNLLDLVQEGNIGLIQAVGKFDPFRGVKLSSYAAYWIRAYILKFILNNWRLVKIGTTQAQRKLFFNLRKEKERLEQLGFEPSTALLAENLQVTEREVEEMERRLAAPEASLDAPLASDDDGARTRLDYLPSEGDRPDRAVEEGEFARLLKDKLEAFAQTLEGRDQTIFRERWLTDAPRTLQEIGDTYGVTRERARQLEKRLLGKLRKYLEAELGTAVDIGSLSRD